MADKRQIEIEELEKKYYNIFLKILQNNEKYIKKEFKKLQEQVKWGKERGIRWDKDNPTDIPLQELMRSIFYLETKYKPFMLAMSSDTVFETEDAIIEIDIKTVKRGDPYYDDLEQIPTHPNQVSYSGKYSTNGMRKDLGVKNYIFRGNLALLPRQKPILTFFVKFVWYWADEDLTEVQIGARDGYPAFTLSSIPNQELSDQYPNLIINAKTYFYLSGETPKDLKRLKPEDIKKEIIESRLRHQEANGYSIDTIRISMAEEKTNPKLTSGWKRHTEIFDW